MRWLTRAAERCEHVVFIARNTLLVTDCYDATAATLGRVPTTSPTSNTRYISSR